MIYSFLKLICKAALNVYFRKIHLEGSHHIPKIGPYIIVANHPSSFLDPLSIAIHVRQKINFLAKGVMFKNKIIASILKGLNMVPIYRAQDDPSMLGKNAQVFSACYKKLAEKSVIMIFPEGTSEMERRLRKIKTGAARIALGAEKENNFELGVKIVPVGLNYTKSSRFRSEVTVNFGEPISVHDYQTQYEQNEVSTSKSLTEEIEHRIRSLMIAIDKEEHDELVERIESIYKTKLDESDDVLTDINASQNIIKTVQHYQETDSKLYDQMAGKIDRYFLKLKYFEISDRSLVKAFKKGIIFKEIIASSIALILGFPLWLIGISLSYIPYKLPRIVALKMTDSEAFYGALLMSLGTVFFMLFYISEIALFHHFIQNTLLTCFFGILLVLSGFFAIYYGRNARRLYFNWKIASNMLFNKKRMIDLMIERKNLLSELNTIGEEYMNAQL